MKKLLIILLATGSCYFVNAQSVGIGTNAPNASAQLDITSTTKGMLIPRMTTAQRTAIAAPANGLMVYDTNFASFYFYNGSAWAAVNSAGGGVSSWTASGNNIFNNNAGNVGIGTNTPSTSALLDINSTTKGLLLPRMTTIQRNGIFLPANGLTVYDTDLKEIYCHNGVQWKKVSGTDTWSSNSIRPWTYTFTDSVGIGTTLPTQRLDVAGNIRSRNNLLVDNNITASNAILAGGNFSAIGTGLVVGEITTNSGVTINNSDGALTLKTGLEDKGFVQLSGNDIRVGTFSSNSAGKFVVRTGGGDQLFVNNTGNVGIDISSPLAKLHIINGADASYSSNGYLMLGPITGTNLLIDNNEILARNNGGPAILSLQNSGGSTQMGVGSGTINFASTGKVARNGISGSADLLPICYGKVLNNGTILGGTNNFSVSRSSTGNYVITLTNEPDLTANQDNYSILVTPYYKTSSSGESSAASIIATISSNNTILVNARKFKLTFDNFLCNCYGDDQLFSLLTSIPIYTLIDVSFSFMIYKM